MHRTEEATNIVKSINKFKRNELTDYELISQVCNYFDKIKNTQLNQADLKFLRYITNISGIPHYYDLLINYGNNIEIDEIDLNTFSALLYESSLHTSEDTKLHKYQQQILNKFKPQELNRFFLSASTSFGKTHLVYEIIQKMNYKNVVLIFPTIALLSENLEKIISDPKYQFFKENFDIHTLSEVSEPGERNLFIYTPERFLSYTDKGKIDFDFVFIDEIYKLDNEYLDDDLVKENERDVAYRLAAYYSLIGKNTDILLAGPYIDLPKGNVNNSFNEFLKQNHFKVLNFNNIELVNKTYFKITDIDRNKDIIIDNLIKINFDNERNKGPRLSKIVKGIIEAGENAIIFCAGRYDTERYAKSIIDSGLDFNSKEDTYKILLEHIKINFSENWILYKALKSGIGIHHGLIPKYIQKEIINLFNMGCIKIILSTTTITEGVNTSAKNLIVMHNKKGDKILKKFDAKNISGRAGRFLQHYSGRIIIFENDFDTILESDSESIKHKNYDKDSTKDEIDLFCTKNEFLNENDLKNKFDIVQEQKRRNLPEDLFNQYKVISRKSKIKIYDSILSLNPRERRLLDNCVDKFNRMLKVDWAGFQILINIIKPIVSNKDLLRKIENKTQDKFNANNEYSVLISLIHFYLKDGFNGSIKYYTDRGKTVDYAVRETANFVYNTLKYHVVKYLGVFNIMYKYIVSKEHNIPIDSVKGIERLLVKMEYNALTDEGRIASDYGVPAKIIEYYENNDSPIKSSRIVKSFDAYETKLFKKVQEIITKSQ